MRPYERVSRRYFVAAWLVIVAMAGTVGLAEDKESKFSEPFSRGFGYVGAFWVTQVSTEVRLFSNDVPLGARLDLNRDLGLRDSFTVPRATLGWRFGKRHILSAGYYNLSRDGVKRLETTIELPGDIEFPVGVAVATDFTTEVGKLQYTYLFYRNEKVKLGIGAGLFVARLGVGLAITGDVGDIQGTVEDFDESVTAPLPVAGFRMSFRITPRWGVLATSDWFILNYSNKYKGILSDTQIYAAHRTWKHVGFAGGINIQTFNVEVNEDDLEWQLDAGLVGILGAVTFYF